MIISLMCVSVGEIFVLILLNLFEPPFVYICGISNFPISYAIFVMSEVCLLCLFWKVKFQAFEANVLASLIQPTLVRLSGASLSGRVYLYVLVDNKLILFHLLLSGRCSLNILWYFLLCFCGNFFYFTLL